MGPYVIIALILLVIIILIRNIRVVQQAKAYVIERLGAYKTTWNVGIHLKVPFIERVAKLIKGGGGGQPHYAQAGGKDKDGISAAVDKVIELCEL